MPTRFECARATTAGQTLFAALEPRQLLAVDTIAVDPLIDFVRDVPPVLSPADAATYGFGNSVTLLGDLNADGIEDFAVTAPGVKPDPLGRFDAPGPGRVFIFSGATLTPIRTLQDGFAGFGASIANMGDLDFDGIPDLAVGSPNFDAVDNGALERHGRVWIFSGASGQVIQSYTGPGPFAEMGYSLASVSDLDGDQISEILIGAPGDGTDTSAPGPGRAFVYHSRGLTTNTFSGENNGDRFGHAVAAGNGYFPGGGGSSGTADFLVGAPARDLPSAEDQGSAYLFDGSSAQLVNTFVLSGTAGPVPGARTGSSVLFRQDNGIKMLIGSPGAGEARSGLIDNWTYLPIQDIFGVLLQYSHDTLTPDANLGERLFGTDGVALNGPVYASQRGSAESLRFLTRFDDDGITFNATRTGEFAQSTSFAWNPSLMIGAFADGAVRVASGAAAYPTSIYQWSPNRTFGILSVHTIHPASSFPAVGLHGAALEPLPQVSPGWVVASVGDSGAFVTTGLWTSDGFVPLDHIRFNKGRNFTPLAAMIDSVEGDPFTGRIKVARILTDDSIFLFTEFDRSYRLVDGVLHYLGMGQVISANASGLTVARAADGANATVLWLPDGEEVRIDGYHPTGVNAVSASGRVLLAHLNQLFIWEDGEVRPFYTADDAFVEGDISDLDTVWVRGYTRGLVHDGPDVTTFTELLLDPDAQLITDLETEFDRWRFEDPSPLSLDGLLVRRRTSISGTIAPEALLIPAGTGALIRVSSSVTSTVAGDGKFTAAASRTPGLGLYQYAGTTLDGEAVTVSSGAALVESSVLYTDARDGRVYIVANIGGTLVWYAQDAGGVFDHGRVLAHGSDDLISGSLATFTSTDGRVHIAALTTAGDLVLVFQQHTAGPADIANWAAANLSADHLTPQELATPQFTGPLTAYVTSWNGLNVAGLDEEGELRVVWWAPGLTLWQTANLSAIAFGDGSILPLTGNVAPYITAWDGINFAVTDTSGAMFVIWWIPSFGGNWHFEDFDVATPIVRPGSLTAYVTPWNGLNIAALTETGEVTTLWWAPETFAWASEPIVPTGATPVDFAGPLTSAVDNASGALNIAGVTEDRQLARLLWSPSFPDWNSIVI